MLKSNHQGDEVLGGGSLWEVITSEDGAVMNGIGALIKEDPTSLFVPSAMRFTAKKRNGHL